MNFDEAFRRVVGSEGSYTNDPLDPGGATRFGISKRAHPGEDIPSLTLDRAKEIYRRDYWGPAGCDAAPEQLKYPLFDMSVNQGVTAAIKALQHGVGETEDGILGPLTLQALQSAPWQRVLFRFTAARLCDYTDIDDARWARFGRGWIRRAAQTLTEV
jgi:lysozyme family protein